MPALLLPPSTMDPQVGSVCTPAVSLDQLSDLYCRAPRCRCTWPRWAVCHASCCCSWAGATCHSHCFALLMCFVLPLCLQLAAKMAAPALVVAGADNLESLHDAFEWALQKMARPGRHSCWAALSGPATTGWGSTVCGWPFMQQVCKPSGWCCDVMSHLAAAQLVAAPPTAGDDVYVIHAEQLASDDDAVESRKRLVQVWGCGLGRRLS